MACYLSQTGHRLGPFMTICNKIRDRTARRAMPRRDNYHCMQTTTSTADSDIFIIQQTPPCIRRFLTVNTMNGVIQDAVASLPQWCLIEWGSNNELVFLSDPPNHPVSFNSARWNTDTIPDLAFISCRNNQSPGIPVVCWEVPRVYLLLLRTDWDRQING